jgi:hypothetical protein
MKLKTGTIVFIIICIFFAGICLFNIIEGNENMDIEGDIPSTEPSVNDTSVEHVSTYDKMKLLHGRVFYSISNTNDDYIVATVDSNGIESLLLTMKHSDGNDTELYENPQLTVNRFGNTKQYYTSSKNHIIKLIIQGGETTALMVYNDGGKRLFISNQYEHFDDSNITSNDPTTASNETTTASNELTTTSNYSSNLFYSSNPNYILKSRVVPQVQTKNPYCLDNLSTNNNLLPKKKDLNADDNQVSSKEDSKEDSNLLAKIKSLIKLELSDSKKVETPTTKYEDAYKQISKYKPKKDEERCPSCKPCDKYPESAFHSHSHNNDNFPRAVINSFSTFGM